MTQRSSLDTVRELYAAFGRGDMAAIFNLLAPKIQWEYPGSSDVPFAGSVHGHDGVRKSFASITADVDFESFEPRSFIAQADNVVVLGFEKIRVKKTGRVYETHWATAWTVSDGKITTFREYTDTAAAQAAFRK